MTDTINIGVALVELEHAEIAARRAQNVLSKLVAAGAATDADRTAFGVIAAQLLATEGELYAELVAAINTLPSEVAQPLVAQIPIPVPLAAPGAPAAGPVHGLGVVVIPPALVWAAVVLAVLLAVVVAVAVVWALKVTIETIQAILLTYRAAETYGDALQARVDCLSAGRSSADCNASIILPPAPTPPGPPIAADPATPWYVGGTVVGALGLFGLGMWFLERRATR